MPAEKVNSCPDRLCTSILPFLEPLLERFLEANQPSCFFALSFFRASAILNLLFHYLWKNVGVVEFEVAHSADAVDIFRVRSGQTLRVRLPDYQRRRLDREAAPADSACEDRLLSAALHVWRRVRVRGRRRRGIFSLPLRH
jgi:hypothetical protein